MKRVVDLAIAAPAFVLSVPLQAVIAGIVAAKLGRPVLFRQTRPGLHGKPFQLVKFRSMRPVDPSRGWTDDASRMTTFGRWLRSTSLDELPTLINVIRGDMSLVGPRPLLMHYLPLYNQEQSRRHDVRPGVTGLAQVSGRNALGWEDRLRLDVEYVDRHGLARDIRILLRTVTEVLSRRGVTGEGHATVAEFAGSLDDVPGGRLRQDTSR